MTDEELSAALDGLLAYDGGATDSGVRDERLRAECTAQLGGMDDTERRLMLARWVRSTYLDEDRLAQGHGLADAAEAIRWLEDDMGIDAV